MLKLYNSISRKLEEFKPLEDGKVSFYHCGPTVYWTQHIGNLRGMTMGDLLVRTLRFLGYAVTYVRNYTDVGHLTSDADTGIDKMEKGAEREGLTPQAIAGKYIDIFEKDTRSLNLVEPDYKPRPSFLIPEIISMVQTLIDKGYAYTTDLAVYFDVSKFPNYTRLSHHKPDKNISGAGKARIEDKAKLHAADFALWVFKAGTHANALQTWISPFGSGNPSDGRGFPGWHIECSVMAKKYLGDTVDIHMGGVEHIPVHHTNEIAQSEAANGKQFVRYWIHNEHLVVEGEKMAKSAGTGMSLSEVVSKGYEPLALRYLYLTAQYRTRQNFTWNSLDAAARSLEQLRNQISSLMRLTESGRRTILSEDKLHKIDGLGYRFRSALADDLNVPQALAVVWETVKSNIPPGDKMDLILDFDEVLGLDLGKISSHTADESPLPSEIKVLIAKRDDLRLLKKFEEADKVRLEIESLGYYVEDSPSGTFVRKN